MPSLLEECQNFCFILWRICQIVFWRSFYFTRHYYLLITDPNYIPNPTPLPPKPSNDEIYANKYLDKFHSTFVDGYNINVNENVHRVFYNAKELKAELEVDNNELELAWRRRVLQETTVRGNIAMYYDPFRLAFVYYADTHIPYPILNAAAMRYVLMYRCRDLFVDEFVYPEDKTSPLIDILINPKKEVASDGETANKTASKLPSNMLGAPFAKLKSGVMTSKEASVSTTPSGIKRVSDTTQRIKSAQSSDKKVMNTFICLGKIMDFPLFQITKPIPTQITQGLVLSYAEFRKNKPTYSAPKLPPIESQSDASSSDASSDFELLQDE